MLNFINKNAKVYMILSIFILLGAVGISYAYYAASVSNDTEVVGQAGGGSLPVLTISRVSDEADGNLIPIDMDTTTLSKAASANPKCVDNNGYSSCQIYSVTVQNNSTIEQSYNVNLTSLFGNNTPNVDAVTMGTSSSEVTNASSIKDNGLICTTNSIANEQTTTPCYFMVLIKNIDSAQTDSGVFNGTVTITSTAGAELKADFGTVVESHPQLGDYVSYTPTVTSYDVDKSMTGYTGTQSPINPSELNLWRVLNINDDGTVDIISEYVSSTAVYFRGQTGYLNFVGYLNVLASGYENSSYTVGSRHFGYNRYKSQTQYITDTSRFTSTAPWTSSTSDNSNEAQGGGDKLYLEDFNKVKSVLGTAVAYKVGTTTATRYWMASRYYNYSSSANFYWDGRYVNTSGNASSNLLYYYNRGSFHPNSPSDSLRPIVTLKSGLEYTGMGTNGSPWQIAS